MLRKTIYEPRFRPSAQAIIRAPLRLRSVGRRVAGEGWSESMPARGFVQLWWVVEGRFEVEVCGCRELVREGDIWILRASDPHRHSLRSESGETRWITLDGEQAGRTMESFGLGVGIKRGLGVCPVGLFAEMGSMVERPDLQAEMKCSELAYQLLLSVSSSYRKENTGEDKIERSKRMMERSFANPEFGIVGLADSLGMHRATLYRRFSARYGDTPIGYLSRLRLLEGLRLLRETGLAVSEISLRCGYRDSNYFAKCIRDATGFSPTGLRSETRPGLD